MRSTLVGKRTTATGFHNHRQNMYNVWANTLEYWSKMNNYFKSYCEGRYAWSTLTALANYQICDSVHSSTFLGPDSSKTAVNVNNRSWANGHHFAPLPPNLALLHVTTFYIITTTVCTHCPPITIKQTCPCMDLQSEKGEDKKFMTIPRVCLFIHNHKGHMVPC